MPSTDVPKVSQLGLFEGFPGARRTDPNSSHIAADRVHGENIAQRQRDEVLAMLKRWPGSTSKELASLSGLDRHLCGRRLPELEAGGYVNATGRAPDAKHELRWWPR